jgi:hypothetical protein
MTTDAESNFIDAALYFVRIARMERWLCEIAPDELKRNAIDAMITAADALTSEQLGQPLRPTEQPAPAVSSNVIPFTNKATKMQAETERKLYDAILARVEHLDV